MSKKHVYEYGLLSPDRTPEAEAHNDAILGPHTLGIEVTIGILADRCGLGNIDPQHHAEGYSSAIEESLRRPLPEMGSTLCTIRPDADSVGAMAILTLRARGKEREIDKSLVSWIGKIDLLGRHRATKLYPELADHFYKSKEVHAINLLAHSETLPLDQKIRKVGLVLCRGMRDEVEALVRQAQTQEKASFSTTMYGPIALMETCGHMGSARNHGQKRYSVSIIVYRDGARFSVVLNPERFDRKGFAAEILETEASRRGMTVADLRKNGLEWGGNPTLFSSPSGKGRESVLKVVDVLKIVDKYLVK